MTDPLGLIGNSGSVNRPLPPPGSGSPNQQSGPAFKELLQEQIAKVNELQNDAKEAVEDLFTGRRDDVESVILATKKADMAFKMLLQVRNKMMDAYEEVKQVRV